MILKSFRLSQYHTIIFFWNCTVQIRGLLMIAQIFQSRCQDAKIFIFSKNSKIEKYFSDFVRFLSDFFSTSIFSMIKIIFFTQFFLWFLIYISSDARNHLEHPGSELHTRISRNAKMWPFFVLISISDPPASWSSCAVRFVFVDLFVALSAHGGGGLPTTSKDRGATLSILVDTSRPCQNP